MSPELAAGIHRVKGVRKVSSRLGNRLTAREASAFWQSPDSRTLTGKRNRAMLAILLGCGLPSRTRELTAKQVPQADAPSEEQLAAFIDKFDAKNAALIWSVRKLLQKRLPTANELVYDNYNFFVIGYCSTERPSYCILSIAAGANGVGLSFYHGATLPIRISYSLAAAAKIALPGSNRWQR